MSYSFKYKQEGEKNPVERTFLAETDDEAYKLVSEILTEEPGRKLVSGSITCVSFRDVPDPPQASPPPQKPEPFYVTKHP